MHVVITIKNDNGDVIDHRVAVINNYSLNVKYGLDGHPVFDQSGVLRGYTFIAEFAPRSMDDQYPTQRFMEVTMGELSRRKDTTDAARFLLYCFEQLARTHHAQKNDNLIMMWSSDLAALEKPKED